MPYELARRGPGPADDAIRRGWEELSRLREDVVARELELANLEGTLSAFAMEKACLVARLYAELDVLDARIAEALLARRPFDPVLGQRASDAREKAVKSSQDAIAEFGRRRPRAEPTPELRALYHRAARKFHPDLGSDGEQGARHDYMVLLNAAWERGDPEAMQELVDDWEKSTSTIEEPDASVQAAYIARTTARLRRTLARLDEEIARLKASPEHALLQQAAEAQARGEDVMGDLTAEVRGRIAAARDRLRALTGESPDWGRS